MASHMVAILSKMTKNHFAEQNLEGGKEAMWV